MVWSIWRSSLLTNTHTLMMHYEAITDGKNHLLLVNQFNAENIAIPK